MATKIEPARKGKFARWWETVREGMKRPEQPRITAAQAIAIARQYYADQGWNPDQAFSAERGTDVFVVTTPNKPTGFVYVSYKDGTVVEAGTWGIR